VYAKLGQPDLGSGMEQIDFKKDNLGTLLEKFQADRVIGMLHSFLILKPIVREAIEAEEKNVI